MIVCYRF